MTAAARALGATARETAGVALLNTLIGWSLLAFGGVYQWAAAPLIAGAIGAAVAVRPPIGRGANRWLDLSVAGLLAAVALQLVPLPPSLLGRLAPDAPAFHVTYTLRRELDPASIARPLSLVPGDTVWALGLAIATGLVFWTARALADEGASRRFIWAVAWLGFATAVYAIVARATTGGRIYGWWTPEQMGAQPYGPMVNRNHYAGWLMMALPLVTGHLLARLADRTRPLAESTRPGRRRWWRGPIDPRGVWLLAATYVMAVALIVSTSRSAVLGLGVGLAATAPLAWGRLGRRERGWLLGGLAMATLVVFTWANPHAISQRLDSVGAARQETRPLIWREALAIARRFPLTGTGLGTFEAAMTVYQRPPRTVFFNHAHSEYVQLLVEGGLLLGLPAGAVLATGVALARRRLAEDGTAGWFRRLGALAALVGLAVQALWEVPLRAPANLLLAAVAAAILVHRPRGLGREAT
jgi:hypothetical protein